MSKQVSLTQLHRHSQVYYHRRIYCTPQAMTEATPSVTPPLAESPLAQYQARLARGELGYLADADGRALFYPRVATPIGYRGELRWAASRGHGTVYATTVIAPKGEAAYNVALIDMDEGFRLMSRVESIPAEHVRIGMRVKVRVHPGGEEGPYPVFDPMEAV